MAADPAGPVALGELVDLTDPTTWSLEALVQATTDHGLVDAGVLTDEALHLAADRVDEAPEPGVLFPVLAGYTAAEREVACAAALRALVAGGDVVVDDHDEVCLAGRLRLLIELRGRFDLVHTVVVDVAGEGTLQARLYRLRADCFLTEEIADDGLHAFALRSLAAQAAWLAGAVDPTGCAASAGEAVTAETVDQLDPGPEQLAAGARSTTALAAIHRPPTGEARADVAVGALSAYGRADGLWLVSPGSADGAMPAWAQPVDGATLRAAAVDQLTAGAPAPPR